MLRAGEQSEVAPVTTTGKPTPTGPGDPGAATADRAPAPPAQPGDPARARADADSEPEAEQGAGRGPVLVEIRAEEPVLVELRSEATEPAETEESATSWFTPGRLALVVASGFLVVYFLAVGLLGLVDQRTDVPVDVGDAPTTEDRITIDARVTDIDPSTRSASLQLRPIPGGRYVDSTFLASSSGASDEGVLGGEFAVPIVLSVFTPGRAPVRFAIGEEQIVDPVGVDIDLTSSAFAYPFDDTRAAFRVQIVEERTGNAVPLDLTMSNAASTWRVAATAVSERPGDQLVVDLTARHDLFVKALVLFVVVAALAVAALAVAQVIPEVLGGSFDFKRLVWLSAMVVAIPLLRSALPGVPPIGSAIDLFVLFPSAGLIVIGLLLASFRAIRA